MPYNGVMKTEVYSFRLTPRLKSELEEVARDRRKSVEELLEEITVDWLERDGDRDESSAERQGLLHEAALQFIGAIEGDRPDRAENARAEARVRVARRHGR
jgi:hypothetical protein